jgi:hypothetical protein
VLLLPQYARSSEDAFEAVVAVSESSEIVHTSLCFIYPLEDPSVETQLLPSDVLVTAMKYDMNSASWGPRQLLVFPKLVEEGSSRAYAIVC